MSSQGRIGSGYGRVFMDPHIPETTGNPPLRSGAPAYLRNDAAPLSSRGGGVSSINAGVGAGATVTGRSSVRRSNALGRISSFCGEVNVADSQVSRSNRGAGPSRLGANQGQNTGRHIVDPSRFNTSSRFSQYTAHAVAELGRAIGVDSTQRWSQRHALFTQGNLERNMDALSPDQIVHYSPIEESIARAVAEAEQHARMHAVLDAGQSWPPSADASPATHVYSPPEPR
jgi:hypothetical protein